MKTLKHAIVSVAAVLAAAGAASAGTSFAPGADGAVSAQLDPGVYNPGAPVSLEKTQWYRGGDPYCHYANGWHGPGWYRCGEAWHRGYGWRGPYGWHHGWHHGWRHDHWRH